MPRKKPQQEVIPGTDADRIKELDSQADTVGEMQEQWQALGQELVREQDKLVEIMKNKGLNEYTLADGRKVELKHIDKWKAKVKKARTADEDEAAA